MWGRMHQAIEGNGRADKKAKQRVKHDRVDIEIQSKAENKKIQM